ncbi:DUF1493 family protein [Dysgonomonas gadei]|uniref:DUF1493 family protein n=1 Tax=Dysgonomonas gadei TaxID=156974 RepID=UPI003AEFDBEE
MENKIEDLKRFILEKAFMKESDIDSLFLSMGIEKDLSFYGDEAVDLICSYGEKFGVDISDFSFKIYFTPEEIIIYLLRKILPCLNPKKKELTIGDLVAGIKAGRLDEEVINASKGISET